MTETINKISETEIEISSTATTKQKFSKQMLLDKKETLDAELARIKNYLTEFD